MLRIKGEGRGVMQFKFGAGMLPDYSAVVAQSERQSLDTVMDAMREAERSARFMNRFCRFHTAVKFAIHNFD